jgi:hypothetical protein
MTLKIAIVTGGTPNLAGPAGVTYLSLKAFSPELFECADKYFFSTGTVDRRSVSALGKLNVKLERSDNGEGISSDASSFTKYFSVGILAKFEPLRLAATYDKVIWIDSDQINTRDLIHTVNNQLCDFGITSGGNNSFVMDNFITKPEILFKDKQLALHNYKAPGVCGNFFIVSKFREGAYERARDLYFRLQEDLFGADQAIICILMQEMYIDHTYYPHDLFTPHPTKWPLPKLVLSAASEMPYFLHAFGQPKFWNGLNDPLWNCFYNDWIKLGGLSFFTNPILGNIKSNLKKYLHQVRTKF